MSAVAVSSSNPIRQIAHRSRGHVHGPITRLISPSDLGEIVKPFVFLDLFENEGKSFDGFGLHPHSGIVTLTYIAEGGVNYEDTSGARGVLGAGAVEWMQAGAGVWHGGGSGDIGRTPAVSSSGSPCRHISNSASLLASTRAPAMCPSSDRLAFCSDGTKGR